MLTNDQWSEGQPIHEYNKVKLVDVINNNDISLKYPLDKFFNTYVINTSVVKSPGTLLDAVIALNSHVMKRGQYEDINNYFFDNPGLKVKKEWQELSAVVGYSISDEFVI